VKFAIDLTGMAGVLYLCGFTYCQLYANLKFTFLVVAFMTLAGSFCYSAFLFQVYAVQSGKGAIVQAIANTQCVIQLLLEIVLDGRIPSGFEITSMCLCISGAFIIAMAKK
jgi:drug/metabolite transporter (DMT)-like permease